MNNQIYLPASIVGTIRICMQMEGFGLEDLVSIYIFRTLPSSCYIQLLDMTLLFGNENFHASS